MPITLTCPSCGGQCAVKEEYAGMQVRCPRCPAVITVPALAPPIPAAIIEAQPASPPMTSPVSTSPMQDVVVSPAPAASAPPPVPPLPSVPSGPAFLDQVRSFLASQGIGSVNQILLFVGLGCMAFFIITVFMPWVHMSSPFGGGSYTSLGIQQGDGIIDFLLVLGSLAMMTFVVLMRWSRLFEYALWTTSNLAIFIALHLLSHLRFAGWGLYISFVVMLAAAGTIGVVAFSKVFTAKTS